MAHTSSEPAASPCDRLVHLLDHLSHFLPAQGPIGVFIHHNTLHAFQHLPFEQAVVEASRLFRTEPYLLERDYRAAYEKKRILREDVDWVLQQEGQDVEIRRLMLVPGVRAFRPETIRFEIEENGTVERFREDLPEVAEYALRGESAGELFRFWLERLPKAKPELQVAARPREGVLAICGADIDDAVHPMLIKLISAYLDQGMAYWTMPNREQGLWRSVVELMAQTVVSESNLQQVQRWAGELGKFEASEAVLAALRILQVTEAHWEPFLQAELLALPGWAGMANQLERDPMLAPHEMLPIKLVEFLAVRLLLVVAATATAIGDPGRWRVRLADDSQSREAQRLAEAAHYFDVAQLAGLGVKQLRGWKQSQVENFRAAVARFDEWERRRVWHLAYERRHERQILSPLLQHAQAGLAKAPARLAAQVFFCIDEREESIRRHLEEIDPEIETFGAAGFFGVAMNYMGVDDARGAALCPVVVKPSHTVMERAAEGDESLQMRRRSLRRVWSKIARHSFVSSRTLIRGWLGTTVLGLFSLFPLAARVLSPRRYGNWMSWLNSMVLPEPRTELAFIRGDANGRQAAEGLIQGFTVEEKADRVASVLGPAGLRREMADVVVILGHGSTSLNNPHESAYNCGACGGRHGGPNARVFAAMANRADVRQLLRSRGIVIPEETWFLAGSHDTCSDDVEYFDLERVPPASIAAVDRIRRSLDAARAASALERTRRFASAPVSRRPIDGLRHVQERAEHLAEPRAEYGHCTNAVCIVGRRALTRELFFDRRAFLVSYDPECDAEGKALASVLGAVMPVCAGINLEYFFSCVDNDRYGAGTKLPHNVTGLLGVMDGCESDLRTGLVAQMVEIHEPVRILFVVETTREKLLRAMHSTPQLWEFLSNRWVRMAVVNPGNPCEIHVYRGGECWELVEGEEELLGSAHSSQEWYHGRREHLGLARIGAGSAA